MPCECRLWCKPCGCRLWCKPCVVPCMVCLQCVLCRSVTGCLVSCSHELHLCPSQRSVIDAYCPHLGANLGIEGTVVGDRIRCAFHGCVCGEECSSFLDCVSARGIQQWHPFSLAGGSSTPMASARRFPTAMARFRRRPKSRRTPCLGCRLGGDSARHGWLCA